jgi:hypothetical protein
MPQETGLPEKWFFFHTETGKWRWARQSAQKTAYRVSPGEHGSFIACYKDALEHGFDPVSHVMTFSPRRVQNTDKPQQ